MIKIINHNKGFINNTFDLTEVPSGIQMTFSNGNTISIQFGFGNYCDNKHESKPESETAEIAIWNEEGKWYDFESDQVLGYCNTDQISHWIHFATNNTF